MESGAYLPPFSYWSETMGDIQQYLIEAGLVAHDLKVSLSLVITGGHYHHHYYHYHSH